METRKKYVALNQALYEQIKRLLQKESVKKIVEITVMGKSQIYKIKCFIETNLIENVFSVLKAKISNYCPRTQNRGTLSQYILSTVEEFNQTILSSFATFSGKCEILFMRH